MRSIALLLARVACAAIGPSPVSSAGPSVRLPQVAQKPAQEPFRAATDLVVIDVSVVSRDGTPVKGLQREHFTVTIDGRTRRIASMTFVDQSIAESPPSPGRPASRYSSNESGVGGRLIMILVDEAVMILRGYKFGHIILDESQAIKNPLSKSAKAARLLNGEHRIVMTGTPVENNTFELWSQFAFLNPGLLGNME